MKQIVFTDKAPAAIGPYSQAVWADNTLYVSGQIPLDPATGTIVNGDIKAQTTRVMQNLKTILETAGLTFDNVVKCSIFVKNMQDFAFVNEVYGLYFNNGMYPARETVEVSALPKNVDVEISCIAIK